jgi:hypothetical protein
VQLAKREAQMAQKDAESAQLAAETVLVKGVPTLSGTMYLLNGFRKSTN